MDDPLCKAFIKNLYDRLARNGTPIVDAAPRLPNGDKGEDILAWLAENVWKRYVILDDHDCFALGPQVRQYWIPIPIDKGLRRREATAAFRLLQGNSSFYDLEA